MSKFLAIAVGALVMFVTGSLIAGMVVQAAISIGAELMRS